MALLNHIRTGQVDAVVCYRDDRLYRHERVVTALMDAVDEADRIRKAPVEIHQATGKIERDFMYLQAMIWRKENEARVARTVLGKMGTLKAGYWPGAYNRLGYKTEPGPRGNRIVIDEPAAATVKAIFTWYDSGRGLTDISRLLIAAGHYQPPGNKPRRVATRARYARGGLSESDLDAILAEIDLATLETRAEIAGLVAARDTARAAAAGAESMRAMIAGWRGLLAEIDVAPGDMAGLAEDEREDIYRARQEIVREVAVAVRVWGVGRFEVEIRG